MDNWRREAIRGRAEIVLLKQDLEKLERDNAELRKRLELARSLLVRYYEEMSERLQLRNILRDTPYSEYAITRLSYIKTIIDEIEGE